MKQTKLMLIQDSLGLFIGVFFFALAFIFKNPAGFETFAAGIFAFQILFLIVRNSESHLTKLFLLFCFTYPAIFILSKYTSIPYHYILQYQDPKLELILWSNGIIFFSILFWSINNSKSSVPLQIHVADSSFYWFSALLALGLIFLAVFMAWPPVLSGYSAESRSSSLFEYSVIPTIFALLSAKTKREKKLLLVLLCLGVFMPLLFQRRGVSIIFFILIFYQITKNLNKNWIVYIILLLAYLGFRAFALIRGDLDLTLTSFLGTHLGEVMSNHQGGVIVSSVTYLGLINDQVWDSAFRAESFIGLFFAPFLSSSANPFPEVFLHLEALKVASIPGSGGFPFVYLYVWGGISMVLLGGIVLRWVMFNTYINPYLVSAKLVVLTTFPRWFAYSLPVGVKYFLITFILAAFLMSFRKKVRSYD